MTNRSHLAWEFQVYSSFPCSRWRWTQLTLADWNLPRGRSSRPEKLRGRER
jgi:hypothetical protein